MSELVESYQSTPELNTSIKYNHQELMEELDRMNRELKEMKESVLKTSVRAHILEADLASLVDPEMMQALRKVQEDCHSCTLAMKLA